MILETLAKTTIALEKRLSEVEATNRQLVSGMKELLSLLGQPEGYLIVGGRAKPTWQKLEHQLEDTMKLDMEELTLEVQFKHAMYCFSRADLDPAFKDMMSEARKAYVKNLIELEKEVSKIADECQEKMAKIEKDYERLARLKATIENVQKVNLPQKKGPRRI